MLVRFEDLSHHINVGEIRRSNDHRIDIVSREQLPVVCIDGWREPRLAGLQSPLSRLRIRIRDGNNLCRIDLHQITDVFATHHACADHAVSDGHRRAQPAVQLLSMAANL